MENIFFKYYPSDLDVANANILALVENKTLQPSNFGCFRVLYATLLVSGNRLRHMIAECSLWAERWWACLGSDYEFAYLIQKDYNLPSFNHVNIDSYANFNLAAVVELPLMKDNSELLLDVLLNFSDFAPTDILGEAKRTSNISRAKGIIDQYKRDSIRSVFMWRDTMSFVGRSESVIKIDIPEVAAVGDMMICSYNDFAENMHSYTFGVLEDLDFTDLVVAGGSVLHCLTKQANSCMSSSDVDIFVVAKTFERKRDAVARTLRWFASRHDVYFSVKNSVISIYITDIPRKFQLITFKENMLADVIMHFDFDYVQVAWDGAEVYCTPQFVRATRTLSTTVQLFKQTNKNRIYKAVSKGYAIVQSDSRLSRLADAVLESTTYADCRKRYKESSTDFHVIGPTTGQTIDEAQEYTICMISKIYNSSIVTKDPQVALDNVYIGGSVLFYDGARSGDVLADLTKKKSVCVESKSLEVIEAPRSHTSGDRVMKVRVNDELLDQALKLALRGTDSRHLYENHILRLTIPSSRTVVYTKRGEPLDHDNGLRAGDMVNLTLSLKPRAWHKCDIRLLRCLRQRITE